MTGLGASGAWFEVESFGYGFGRVWGSKVWSWITMIVQNNRADVQDLKEGPA